MASSDEEGEILPKCVTDYYLVSTNESPVSLAFLPLQLSDGVGSETLKEQVYLRGTVDSGIQTIFKEVIAWKFELSYVLPEVFVLSKSSNWIKLHKPKKSYENIVRTILVTVYCMHFAKKTPDASATSLWNHLRKFFSTFDEGPSERDILHHIPIISAAVSVDNDLIRSKYLLNILKWRYGKEVTPFEKAVPIARKQTFIVDDDDSNAEENEENEDEMDELFDRVCSFCDDGGELLCCDGRCLRSFHPTKEAGSATGCESLGFLSDAQVKALSGFQCQNCQDQQHQCFVCGLLGSSDIASGAEVFPCISATCGHFYHPACVAKLIHLEDTTKAADLHNRIAGGESFTCPAHKCSLCKKVEDKTIHELQFAICRRCPTSYHQKCMPKGLSFECTGVSSTRAWEGLLKNRILIYCMKHIIDPELKTPERNHILFSDTQRSGMGQQSRLLSRRMQDTKRHRLSSGRMEDTKRDSSVSSKRILPQNIGFNMPKQVNFLSKRGERGFSRASSGARNCHNISLARTHPSNYTVKSTLAKAHCSSTDARRHLAESSELVEQLLKGNIKPQNKQRADIEKIRIKNPEMICMSSSWSNKAAIEERIAALKKKSDASFNEAEFRSKISVVSTHSSDHRKMMDKAIPHGRVEASVNAVRAALRKLEQGGTLEEAKAVCEPQILNQIMIWKRKLRVYLAPFIHGMRYTSYGRHFTKFEKLQEVVNRLHNYVLDGDMIVDFCCGSNDFSCLMKKKLDEMGKCCSFRNYDIIQPKNDFCYENRDWMSVAPKELPDGSKLIMGLNPPFGVKASLANKFINKALEFKPKLIILIVPEETQRLDDKCDYDLIWEDRKIFSGKSFYLPGSVDVHNKQIEQWNNSPPPLYLWSRSDWSNKHRSIAKQHGHAFMLQGEANGKCDSGVPAISNYLMEETHGCYEDFSHIIPDNVDMSKIFDDIPDPDFSDESEPDEVLTTPAGECSAKSYDIQVRHNIHSGSKREDSLSPENSVLHCEESCLPVKKRVHHLACEGNSTPDLLTPAMSDKSLIREGSRLSQPQNESKPSSSNTVHMNKIISTTQGAFSSSQSVPAGRFLGNKEVNQFTFDSVSQLRVRTPSVLAGVNFSSVNELILSAARGPESFDWQTNPEYQSYAYNPAPQLHHTYGNLPRGNNMQNQNYYHHQAGFPQITYVPQYMPSEYVSPYTSNAAPFFQSRYANDDDLPPIPGLGTTPSSYGRP